MKIISHIVVGNMLRIGTDNPDRPVFVYEKDKFRNLAELKKEINKSIDFEKKRKDKSDKKFKKVKKELEEN